MTEAVGWEGSAGPLGADMPDVGTGDDDSEKPSPGFEEFRARLVAHFTVAWAKREVVWFQRAAVSRVESSWPPDCALSVFRFTPCRRRGCRTTSVCEFVT